MELIRKIKYLLKCLKAGVDTTRQAFAYYKPEKNVAFFTSLAGFVGEDAQDVCDDFEIAIDEFQFKFKQNYEKNYQKQSS